MSVAAPTIATETVARPRVEHLGGVDWLRILGITAVAYFHTGEWYPDAPGQAQALAGLHALTAAAAFFAATSRSATSDRDIVVKRFHRLIIPFLFFSLPFMAKAIQSGKFQWWMIWMGGSQHLWFLPFIFVVSCAIAMARRRDLIVRGPANAVAWTIAAVVLTVVEPVLTTHVPANGLVQIMNTLPAVAWGLAIFALPSTGMAVLQTAIILAAGVAATLLAPARPVFWAGSAACGSMLFAIARLLPIAATPTSRFLGRTSFGVYLVHALALGVVVRVVAKLLHAQSPAVASDPYGLIILAQVVVAIVGSIVAVAILEKTPLRRFIA